MTRHVLTLTLLAFSHPVFSQSTAPQVLHTQLTTASDGLAAHLHATQPTWLGYSIRLVPNLQLDGTATGALDLNHEGNSYTRSDADHTTPEYGVVLLHVDQNNVDRIRLVDPTRVLDAGNQPFVWLSNVSATDSIHQLSNLATQSTTRGDTRRIFHGALFAIAVHDTPEATAALISLAAPSNPTDLREQASFWLANQRGHEGFLAIQKETNDPNDEFRKKLTFHLTVVKEPAALDELIRMAHSDASPEVRKQAQFWMATKGGKKVAGDLDNIASNDPDSAIRKQAVFAISRLPDGESTTRLIALASNSKDPAVRKQAVFWLGQSKDPHALDYLTSLVKQ